MDLLAFLFVTSILPNNFKQWAALKTSMWALQPLLRQWFHALWCLMVSTHLRLSLGFSQETVRSKMITSLGVSYVSTTSGLNEACIMWSGNFRCLPKLTLKSQVSEWLFCGRQTLLKVRMFSESSPWTKLKKNGTRESGVVFSPLHFYLTKGSWEVIWMRNTRRH